MPAARPQRQRVEGLDAQLAEVRAAREAQHPLPAPAELVFSYTLAMLEAERDWLAGREGEKP